jgi:hypothetical protein
MMGRWIWTDYGWYWSSYEPFGWATYHYGRWIYDDYYGWIWVPDDVWGPAWVEWRYDNDYIGWAPLPPYANFSVSIGLTFGRHWAAPVHYWNFVPCGNFSSVHINNYVQPVDVSRRIFGRTRSGGHVRSVDRRIVNDGVGLDRVERVTRERIRKVEIADRREPGEERIVGRNNRDRLEVYRPNSDELRRESVTPSVRDRTGRQSAGEPGNDRIRGREPNEAERQAMEKQSTRRRDAQRPDVNRESRTQQPRREQLDRGGSRQQSPQREQYNRSRQQSPERRQYDRSPRQQDRGQQNVGKQRPEVSRQRPEVSRERPSVRRDKPDGGGSRSGQSGRRRPNG